jgi:transmembrane protein 216
MKPNGHFMFQTMIAFNKVFSFIYFISEIALFIYKDVNLYYPPHTISVEITCLVFFLIVQLVRFYLGALGNRSETSIYVMFCLIFIIVPLYTFVHFLILQTYVLYIEMILNGIGIGLTVIELVFCLLSMMAISSQEKTM